MPNRFGPQYVTADGKFTTERPKWMKPRGCGTPDLSEYEPEPAAKSAPAKPQGRTSKLSTGAAQKIAEVLHVMLNDKK